MARAIASLKYDSAPEGDGIPAEVWKDRGVKLFNRLHQLFTNAWEMGSIPQAWKDASIVTIYKKGDRTDCGNYIGISLLSIAGKIFARIILNRLSIHRTPDVVPETQCGFRSHRSTVDMVFCLRQLQERCIEQDRPLYVVFVDFTKAFDTVGRTGLWQQLRKYGCPEKFTTMIEALHTGMMASVSIGNLGQSDKQGNTRTDAAALYGRSSDQKESPVDWTRHEDILRQTTKADSLLSTVFRFQKERAPSSPVQLYHQEKPEAERYKDRLMAITLTAES
jgi:hypothetical protein